MSARRRVLQAASASATDNLHLQVCMCLCVYVVRLLRGICHTNWKLMRALTIYQLNCCDFLVWQLKSKAATSTTTATTNITYIYKIQRMQNQQIIEYTINKYALQIGIRISTAIQLPASQKVFIGRTICRRKFKSKEKSSK